ncbi:hypothetical protein [Agriterribacter sp.]|uniref:hypothetical protein n=1 Tax=Agriterribacter sp. TaxID=2821509 RepID=UPI002C7C46F1|nr:hypothetical protein [Agriterribacter sp.]HRP55302.1 hypothetical protein [Agriterribacter sp.]
MKKQLFITLIFFPIALYNCTNTTTPSDQSKENTPEKAFYPVGNYILSQLSYIDSMPLAVIKYTTIHNVTDTSIIEKKDFRHIAAAFITPDISSAELKPQYEEHSFIDATLGTITLTYTTENDKLPVRKADILLNQENTGVKTIYIEKNIPGADPVIKKMLWIADRNCQITTLVQKEGQPEQVIFEKYVWDEKH